MPSPILQMPVWLTWTHVSAALASLAAVVKAAVSLVQYVERRHEKSQIERNFGADYYPSDVIEASLRYYVRPYCTSVDPAQEAEIRQVVSTREDLFQAVERFLARESPYRHILLLADSGMGKTSFVINYYAHNLKLKRGRRRRLAVIPLGVPSALEDISKIEDKKNTVIFLDAFDEDPEAMKDHRGRLDKIMKACTAFNRVLITCRTQFFGSDEEIPKDTGVSIVAPRTLGESAYEFWKLYISPLTDDQVAQFLRKRFPWFMWSKRREALNLITKIPFLTVRPMLLTYLPDVMRVGQRIEYAFQIYELMVERWLKREKGIDPIQLREFSEWLATDLYTNREKRKAEWLPPDEFSKLLPKYNSALDAVAVRRRSLLNRDARGNLKFAHRSIMEYLYVYRFISQPTATRAAIAWTDLMKMFAVEMIKAHTISANSNSQQQPLQLQAADLSGVDFSQCTASSICLDNAKLHKAKFKGANLANSTFMRADLREADFSGSDLTDIDFTGADLSGADLRSTVRTRVVLTDAFLEGTLLEEEKPQQVPIVKGKQRLLFKSRSTAIQLGTSATRIYVFGKGVIVEPSIIGTDRSNGLEVVGSDALRRDQSHMSFIHPVEESIISEPEAATRMLRHLLTKAHGSGRSVSRALVAIPAGATKANRNALYEVVKNAKVNEVRFIEKCFAAAIGAGLPLTEPIGNMIVSIGAGTTDIAVIALGGIVYSRSVRMGGNQMDEAVVNYLKRKYNLLIGQRTAEIIKIEIGSAYPLDRPLTMEIKGRNLIEGTPKIITIDDSEIREALAGSVSIIMNAIRVALERTPPELSADINDRGIVLNGGGALLKNMDKRIREETGLPVTIADDPFLSIVLGMGKLLNDWKLVEAISVD